MASRPKGFETLVEFYPHQFPITVDRLGEWKNVDEVTGGICSREVHEKRRPKHSVGLEIVKDFEKKRKKRKVQLRVRSREG